MPLAPPPHRRDGLSQLVEEVGVEDVLARGCEFDGDGDRACAVIEVRRIRPRYSIATGDQAHEHGEPEDRDPEHGLTPNCGQDRQAAADEPGETASVPPSQAEHQNHDRDLDEQEAPVARGAQCPPRTDVEPGAERAAGGDGTGAGERQRREAHDRPVGLVVLSGDDESTATSPPTHTEAAAWCTTSLTTAIPGADAVHAWPPMAFTAITPRAPARTSQVPADRRESSPPKAATVAAPMRTASSLPARVALTASVMSHEASVRERPEAAATWASSRAAEPATSTSAAAMTSRRAPSERISTCLPPRSRYVANLRSAPSP